MLSLKEPYVRYVFYQHFLGLVFEVFLDQKNYMLNKLSKKAGARLVIHDPKSPPLADEYGVDLQPNTATSVSIQQVRNVMYNQGKFYFLIF